MTRFPLHLLFLPLAACTTAPATSLVLHYDRPAKSLDEALPLGNGRLGALVYGGTEEDRISLNDITLWTVDIRWRNGKLRRLKVINN